MVLLGLTNAELDQKYKRIEFRMEATSNRWQWQWCLKQRRLLARRNSYTHNSHKIWQKQHQHYWLQPKNQALAHRQGATLLLASNAFFLGVLGRDPPFLGEQIRRRTASQCFLSFPIFHDALSCFGEWNMFHPNPGFAHTQTTHPNTMTMIYLWMNENWLYGVILTLSFQELGFYNLGFRALG